MGPNHLFVVSNLRLALLTYACKDFPRTKAIQFMKKKPKTVKTDSARHLNQSEWMHRPIWERCEKRLAMSAMPWMPWDVGPQEPFLPALSNASPAVDPAPGTLSVDAQATLPIETHLSDPHAQTGWNQVHAQYGLSGKGQTVAVIDSGIAFDHVALGKGFGPGYKVVGGWDFAENDPRPYDDAPAGFHGTHVAGIIGANDGVHFGIAPNVDLVALRVFNDTGKGELAWAENALKWVHENRETFANPITTVNLSLGSTWNSSTFPTGGTLDEELGQLQRDGIVVVVSAGNSFQQNKSAGLSYPAASPFVVPASSIDANGQLSDFSQRDSRSIAAPGRAIESTVPDYFYGKDGINDDWAKASGTSMASPYIAGASVLVREAMEMAGVQNITPQSIYEQLRSTANSIWDSVTQQSYQSLNLERAIESLLPKDNVGDSIVSGQLSIIQNSWQTDGWINSLGDQDVYRLAPAQSGTISLQLGSEYVDNAIFSLLRDGTETALHTSQGRLNFSVVAGESIGLRIADTDSIGPYHLNWSFAASVSGGQSGSAVPSDLVDLGSVDLLERSLSGASRYKATAEHTGILSVVVDAGQQNAGTLQVFRPTMSNGTLVDSTVENNQWRIDVNVVEGQSIEFVLPGSASRHVHVVNLLNQQGNQLTIHGTDAADVVRIDLSNGVLANVAGINYQLDGNSISTIVLDGTLNNDTLSLVGSSLADKIEMRPGITTLSNEKLSLQANNFETVQFVGGGGPDRAYLFDAATDDRLNIWPNKAELTGIGYAFSVDKATRIFVNADLGGDDQAFVFDSVGDDTLSVRPQFTSLSGPGFFNYVSGFERVFAYATQGGVDRAALYDSAGNDTLSSSSEITSIVGPGFSTFARGFENVEAFASAGGIDRATIYAPRDGSITAGADFVGMQDATSTSIARNFERIETFLAGQSVPSPAYIKTSVFDDSQTPQESQLSNGQNAIGDTIAAALSTPSIPFGPIQANHTGKNAIMLEKPEILIQSRVDWLSLMVDSVNQPISPTSPANSMEQGVPNRIKQESIDLSWLDPQSDRLVLDEIFSKL